MKRWFITWLMFISMGVAYAQNLIPNPGFEDLIQCPDDEGQITLAAPWQPLRTPDLYHSCAYFPFLRPPKVRVCDIVEPHGGEGFVGIYVYGPGPGEFLEAELLSPLEEGALYYARFYVATDDDCELGTPNTYTDAIAMGLGKQGLHHDIAAENKGMVINDTMGWTVIGGCYQAKGTENSVRIGNYYSDFETILEATPDGGDVYFNYLFIDDISLHKADVLPDTLLLCPDNDMLALDASFLDASYQWSTGDTTSSISTNEAGSYTVAISLDGCVIKDTVEVIRADIPNQKLPDTIICDDRSIELIAPIPGNYQWSTGAKTKSITTKQAGNYAVTITNECGEFTFEQFVDDENCACNIYVPTAFSPNGDGRNDWLEVFTKCRYPANLMRYAIYDRWGNEVFQTDNLNAIAWDGTINGHFAPAGIYCWYLQYTIQPDQETREITESGHFNLIR